MFAGRTGSWALSRLGETIRHFGKRAAALAAFALLALAGTGISLAQTFTSLYSFGAQTGDGSLAIGQPVRDAAGNVYGTTYYGGANQSGTVFKIDSTGKESLFHSFGAANDGSNPYAGLIQDAAGNLYGTTFFGGLHGYGIVFKLDTAGNETVLHNFNGDDGALPYAGVILDSAGNVYGTTSSGGLYGYGAAFKIDSTGTETVLHSFSYGDDGAGPSGSLFRDSAGNLYGTAGVGGANQFGNVFKIDTSGNFSVLHAFGATANDGVYPQAGVIQDAAGNLYGTTYEGGTNFYGTVFKIDSSGNYTVLHNFSDTDGSYLQGPVIRDSAGNLYGTTTYGGINEVGTVFKLDPAGNLTTLHSFDGADGQNPYSGLIQDAAGSIYGTTLAGGTYGDGTVFKLTSTVPFSSFSAKLDITSGPPPGYQLNANVTQGAGAPAINVLSQGMTLSIGPSYRLTIPGSAFTQTKQGAFVYQMNSLQVRITETGVNPRTGVASWQVQVQASGVNLTGLSHPSVTLTLGTNTGTTTP